MGSTAIHLDLLIERMLKANASELRLSVEAIPKIYLESQFKNCGPRPLTNDDMIQIMKSITPDAVQEQLRDTDQACFDFNFGNEYRLFVRISHWNDTPTIVIRPDDLSRNAK